MQKKLFLLLLMAVCSATAFSQITTSSLNGEVKSDKNELLPSATIKVVFLPTGSQYSTSTREDGRFNLPNLRSGGPYLILASFVGYETDSLTNVYLELGSNTSYSLVLKDASQALNEVVVKSGKNDFINDKRKGTATNITDLNKLPSLNRSIQDATRTMASGNLNSFGGSNYRYNNLSIDGIAHNDAFGFQEPTSGAGGSVASGTPGALSRTQPISMDVLQEIQVNLSPYDVSIGSFTGGSINAVTKSGTNQTHGTIYNFSKNQYTTAKLNDAGTSKRLAFGDYQTGVSLGGAIKKNKLFYFGNFEYSTRYEPVLFEAGSTQSIFSVADIERISTFLKNKYNYDVGSYDKFELNTKNTKAFLRFDANLNDKNKLVVRYNFVDAKAENLTRGPTIMNFGSQAFTHNSVTHSLATELSTRISNRVFNKLIAGVSQVYDQRDTPGDLFPHTEITYKTSGTIFLGTYREAAIFGMKQNAVEITDNLNVYLKNHSLTFGTHNELYNFQYSFVTPWNGRWAYSSIDNFLAEKPSRIRGTYHFGENTRDYNQQNPSAAFRAWLMSFYVQDEFNLTSKINISVGVRLETGIFPDQTNLSPDVIKTPEFSHYSSKIKSNVVLSPRFGFNWQLDNNKKLQLRGGSGVFSGRVPFAWFAYNYLYNGQQFGNVDIRPTTVIQQTLDVASLTSATSVKREINLIDPNFKLPRVWRSNLALDMQLPKGYMLTVEGLYTKTIYDVLYQNLNLKPNVKQFVGNDNRDIYVGSGDAQRINPQFTSVFLLTNTRQGYRYNITTSLRKTFFEKLNTSISYNYGESKDVMNGVRVSHQANWEWNQATNINNPALSYSNFDIRHKIALFNNYEKVWNKRLTSSLSVIYTGVSGSPFSYIYAGDYNRDGSSTNDLAYIPTAGSELQYTDLKDATGKIITTAAQQAQQFDDYISKYEYLNKNRGKLSERNGGRTPWNHNLDLRFTQKIGLKGSQKLEITLDLINFLNLLNKEYGKQRFVPNTTNSGYQLLTYVNEVNGKPSFQFNNPTTTPWQTDPIASRWQGQLGLRLSF